MRYSELLARVHAELAARAHPEHTSTAADEEAHAAFGQSIGTWPVFPDTLDALARLSKHFKLTVLSNVDRASFAHTQRVLEGPPEAQRFAFAAVYTAEDAGAYKPDPRAREYALRRVEAELGVKREEVIVVAVSVTHDIKPSRAVGLGTAWIMRRGSVIGWDEEEGRKATWTFETLGDMAEAAEREAAAGGA